MYISASCVISQNAVYKNSRIAFENKGVAVADFLLSVYHQYQIKYPKYYKMDNPAKLGFLAAEILLKDSFTAEKYNAGDIGVVLTNAASSLDTDTRYFETAKTIASPSLFVYTLPNIMMGEICIRHHFKGENAFFIFEQFDAKFIEQYVGNLVSNGILQACICGWVDLLEEDYKAVLFLVEKNADHPSPLFTIENINKIYHLHDG